jgi:hypothetical protein
MKKVKIFAAKRLLISAAFAAAAVLVIAACVPFVDPAEGTPFSSGKGGVAMQLGVDGAGQSASAARTLLPATVNAGGFDSFDLKFTPDSGEPTSFTGHTALAVELDVGTYTLELKAYKGTELAAEGTASGIVVAAGIETPVSVALGFKATNTGTGTLAVTVTAPSGLSVSGAAVAWTPLSGGTGAGRENVSLSGGTVTLKGGYYLVAVTLTNGERTAKRSDIAHIGAGQTTPLVWAFVEGDFATIVDYIRLVGIPAWGDGAPAAVAPNTENPDGTYTWLVNAPANATFRFILDDTSSYEDKWWARWFYPETNKPDVSAPASYAMGFSEGKTDNAWELASGGYYSLTVDPYAKTLAVTKPTVITGVTINEGNVSLNKGGTMSFTATVQGHNNPNQAVTWAVSGANKASTTFNGNTLTVALDETAATLTVTATTGDETQSASVTVTVTAADALTIEFSPSDKWSGTLEVSGGNTDIAKSSGSLTITVTGSDFTSFVWIVDGDVFGGQTGASITLTGTNYALGGHSVTVYAFDADDVPWSPESPVEFTVTK